MPIDEFERANPIVLHARLSASIARETFGVGDPEILSAIEKHTTAAREMSPLDCAVYLADGLEPGRGFPERAAIWQLAASDLGNGMRALLLHGISYYERKAVPIAPQTAAAARAFGLNVLDPKEVHASAN